MRGLLGQASRASDVRLALKLQQDPRVEVVVGHEVLGQTPILSSRLPVANRTGRSLPRRGAASGRHLSKLVVREGRLRSVLRDENEGVALTTAAAEAEERGLNGSDARILISYGLPSRMPN